MLGVEVGIVYQTSLGALARKEYDSIKGPIERAVIGVQRV